MKSLKSSKKREKKKNKKTKKIDFMRGRKVRENKKNKSVCVQVRRRNKKKIEDFVQVTVKDGKKTWCRKSGHIRSNERSL